MQCLVVNKQILFSSVLHPCYNRFYYVLQKYFVMFWQILTFKHECVLGRLFSHFFWTGTFSSVLGWIFKSKYHKSLHSIVNGGFGLQESLSHWTYTLLLLIEVRHLNLLFRFQVSFSSTFNSCGFHTYCEVLLCRSTNSEITESLSFGLALTKHPFQEQRNGDLESSRLLSELLYQLPSDRPTELHFKNEGFLVFFSFFFCLFFFFTLPWSKISAVWLSSDFHFERVPSWLSPRPHMCQPACSCPRWDRWKPPCRML